MPTSQQVLDGLTTIANDWRSIATAWHVLLAALLLGLYQGWRPSTHLIRPMLVLPLACVSALAWASGNSFNGGVFTALTLTLGALSLSRSNKPVRLGSPRIVMVGVGLVVFGWTYPHFVTADSWSTPLYAAPLGLIPCPTLSAVVGLSLMLNGLGSRAWSSVLSAAGIAYGMLGFFWLDVAIDIVLVAGAGVLGAVAVASSGLSASPGRLDRGTTKQVAV